MLHGDSNLGKTQLAMTMMCAIAQDIFETPERPYFLKVETIEGLKEAASGYIKKGVAILFDDIEPSKVRGTRKGSTLEDLKNLTEVTTTSTLHARFKDIVIDENEPRCFTSNAANPSEWHEGLPADVFVTSDFSVLATPPASRLCSSALSSRTCRPRSSRRRCARATPSSDAALTWARLRLQPHE